MGHDLKGNIIASPNEGISWLSVHHVLCCPDFHHCIHLWPCHTYATVSIHDSLLLSFLLGSHPLIWKPAGLISSKDSELVVFFKSSFLVHVLMLICLICFYNYRCRTDFLFLQKNYVWKFRKLGFSYLFLVVKILFYSLFCFSFKNR